MIVKNNYNECLTNLACSIRKYFDLDYNHNTLDYIDKILEDYKPKNVVTILCDGMGSNILDRMLDKDSFLIKNRLKTITSVFPATTVAATLSMLTGLNPCETGMLGWDMYYKDIDKTITVFINSEKGDPDFKPLQEAIDYHEKYDTPWPGMDYPNPPPHYVEIISELEKQSSQREADYLKLRILRYELQESLIYILDELFPNESK